MKQSRKYLQFVTLLEQNIIQSRYHAASLASRELLLLYFKIGKILKENIEVEKWVSKVVDQISEDLQKQLPGLRGFSRRNLLTMKQFFTEYNTFIIGPLPTAQLITLPSVKIVPSATAQLNNTVLEAFLLIQL